MSDRSETKQPADEGRLDRRVRRVVDARELATHSEIADAVRGIEKERRDAMRELMRDFDQSYYYPNLKDMREACGRIGHKWRFSHHGPLGDPWFLCGVCHAHECRPERESAELAAERARADSLHQRLVALEDEKNTYMDYVGDALGQDHDRETLWDAAQRVLSDRDRLRTEIEKAAHKLETARIWGGHGWLWQPAHPEIVVKPVWEILRAALKEGGQ